MRKLFIIFLFLFVACFFISSSSITHLDAGYGKKVYKYWSFLLIKWRIGILKDYHVMEVTDVLSYFTSRTMKDVVTEDNRYFYIENLKSILNEIQGVDYFDDIKHRLMIDAVYLKDLKVFEILYCTYDDLNTKNVKHYDQIADVTLNLDVMLLEHPEEWKRIKSSCRIKNSTK